MTSFMIFSPRQILLVIKHTRINWRGICHVCGKREILRGIWWGNLKVRYNLEALDIDVKIIISGIYIKRKREGGLNLSASDEEQVVGCCEPGNENSGSIKRWNFSTS
jgi:hypothetical protein